MSKRTIIFGDIHACHKEWQTLMNKIKIKPSDDLICVGDVVCKGPSTKKVLDIAMSLDNLQCILGNHELHLLNAWKNNQLDNLSKAYQFDAIRELGNELETYMNFMAQWPLYIETEDYIVLHAGLKAGIPLNKQSAKDLTTLRTLEDKSPWYEHYQDTKLIVHGHWARQGLVVRENVIGLDTGCVYGKELTACILPERKIVSVPAEKTYISV